MMRNNVDPIHQKNVIWNAMAGIINAGEAVVVLAVVSWVNDLKDAGALSLAFSLANLFMTIGKFGMRSYQAAHDGDDFSFKTFLNSRIVTVIFMVLVSFLYTLYCFVQNQYALDKFLVIFIICMWYAVEAFEDVFIGKYQTMGRLDIGSKLFSIRWVVTISAFIIADLYLQNIVRAAMYALGMGVIVEISGILYLRRKYRYDSRACVKSDRGLKALFDESKFLCVSSFLYYYMTNIPKYAINSYLGDELQAIYGYISMPIFVIALLNGFIYQPQLMKYIIEWKEGQIEQFAHRVIKQLCIIGFIMLICILGAYVVGIPVLSILYHQDLGMYKPHLLVLLAGGGFLAIGVFLANMLTIMEQQRISMVLYAIVSFFGYIVINLSVKEFHLNGAVWGYTFTMLFLVVIFGIAFLRAIPKDVN